MTRGRTYASHDQLLPPFPGCKMATKEDWDYANDEDLIDLYEANRCLYDTGIPEYANRDMKDNTKQQIAKRLKTTGELTCRRFVKVVYYRSLPCSSSDSVCEFILPLTLKIGRN